MNPVFASYVLLSGYNLGAMWVLQWMHYPLYALVGAPEFVRYVEANNRRSVAVAILPAVLNVVASGLLLAKRPPGVPTGAIVLAIALGGGVMVSSVVWQARMHAELVATGRSLELIDRLVTTNWVRTACNSVQAALAMWMVSRVMATLAAR